MVSQVAFSLLLASASSTNGFINAVVLPMASCEYPAGKEILVTIEAHCINKQSFGSANIASAALSPIFARLLDKYGPRTTLIGWTVFIAITISLGILCIRSRHPHATNTIPRAEGQKVTLKPFKSPYFWLFVSSMAVQSLANNLPANYLPSYATDFGVDSTKAALLVTYLSLSGIIGQVSLGALT
jgi:cyanate permease